MDILVDIYIKFYSCKAGLCSLCPVCRKRNSHSLPEACRSPGKSTGRSSGGKSPGGWEVALPRPWQLQQGSLPTAVQTGVVLLETHCGSRDWFRNYTRFWNLAEEYNLHSTCQHLTFEFWYNDETLSQIFESKAQY